MEASTRHRYSAWPISSRISYVLWRKSYTGGLPARMRAFWHHVLRCYGCETCGECGRRVGQAWVAPESLWLEVMADEGGLLCIRCFDIAHEKRGHFIRWVPTAEIERRGRMTASPPANY